jgi:alpha-mannosidase
VTSAIQKPLVYIDGVPYAACDRHHREVPLQRSEWADGQPHLLALHGWTGIGGFARGDPFTRLYMHPCWVVQIDSETRELIAATRVALGTIENLELNDPVRPQLLNALDEAYKILDTRDPLGQCFYNSVRDALAVLQERISQAGHPLEIKVHASGHAHIDVAWLWTLAQTRRKAERTFFNVVRLMESSPNITSPKASRSSTSSSARIDQSCLKLFALALLRVVGSRLAVCGWKQIAI